MPVRLFTNAGVERDCIEDQPQKLANLLRLALRTQPRSVKVATKGIGTL